MSRKNRLDNIRGDALNSMTRSEMWFKLLVVLSGLAEIAGLVAVFLLMNWGDPTHRLILSATMLVYITLGLWVWALAMRNRVGEQRILRAIEVIAETSNGETE